MLSNIVKSTSVAALSPRCRTRIVLNIIKHPHGRPLQMRAVKEAEEKADKELDVLMSDFSGLMAVDDLH